MTHRMRRTLFPAIASLLALLALSGCVSSLARCGKVFEPARAGAERSIQPEGVCLADGTFALFRKEGKVTAVRLTTITPRIEGEVSSGCARYEAYAFASEGTKGAAGARSEGTVSTFDLRGFHPFNWQPGHDRLRVANLTLLYFHPACLYLFEEITMPTPPGGDPHVEYATTRWRHVQEIDPADPTLVWYRPDSFRERAEETSEPKKGGL